MIISRGRGWLFARRERGSAAHIGEFRPYRVLVFPGDAVEFFHTTLARNV